MADSDPKKVTNLEGSGVDYDGVPHIQDMSKREFLQSRTTRQPDEPEQVQPVILG